MKYYIAENGTQAGPFEINELFQHGMTVNSLVWCEGMANWTPAGQVPELAAAISTRNITGGTQLPNSGGIPTGNPLPTGNSNTQSTFPQQQQPTFPQQQQPTWPQQQQQQPTWPQQQQQQQYQLMPKTWITASVVVAVMSLLCCSNPVGLIAAAIAIFKGTRVKSNYNSGNYEAANQASKSAKMWLTIAIIIMVVWFCVSLYKLTTDPEFLQQILEQMGQGGVTIPNLGQ